MCAVLGTQRTVISIKINMPLTPIIISRYIIPIRYIFFKTTKVLGIKF